MRYFGLGYPSVSPSYLAAGRQLPDLIVSADLEVFEDLRIFSNSSRISIRRLTGSAAQGPYAECGKGGLSSAHRLHPAGVLYWEPEACAKTLCRDWRGQLWGNNTRGKNGGKVRVERWGQVPPPSLGESLVADMPIRALSGRCVRGRPAPPWSSLYALPSGRPGDLSPRPPGGRSLIPYLYMPALLRRSGRPAGWQSAFSP